MKTFPNWREAGQAMRWARKNHPGLRHDIHRLDRGDGAFYTSHNWWLPSGLDIDIAPEGGPTYEGDPVSDFGVTFGKVHAGIEGADADLILSFLASLGLVPKRYTRAWRIGYTQGRSDRAPAQTTTGCARSLPDGAP